MKKVEAKKRQEKLQTNGKNIEQKKLEKVVTNYKSFRRKKIQSGES